MAGCATRPARPGSSSSRAASRRFLLRPARVMRPAFCHPSPGVLKGEGSDSATATLRSSGPMATTIMDPVRAQHTSLPAAAIGGRMRPSCCPTTALRATTSATSCWRARRCVRSPRERRPSTRRAWTRCGMSMRGSSRRAGLASACGRCAPLPGPTGASSQLSQEPHGVGPPAQPLERMGEPVTPDDLDGFSLVTGLRQSRYAKLVDTALRGIGVTRWLAEQGARVLVSDRDPPDRLEAATRQLADLVESGRLALELGGHRRESFERCDIVVAQRHSMQHPTPRHPHLRAGCGTVRCPAGRGGRPEGAARGRPAPGVRERAAREPASGGAADGGSHSARADRGYQRCLRSAARVHAERDVHDGGPVRSRPVPSVPRLAECRQPASAAARPPRRAG